MEWLEHSLGYIEDAIVASIEASIKAAMEGEQHMSTEPKFKVGDRVNYGLASNKVGVITEIETHYIYTLRQDDGVEHSREESYINGYAKLSEEDAWIEVALMIGAAIRAILPMTVWESDRKDIRHKAYQILGGNGINCTKDHEAIKARLNSLIERAERV